ncbi:D-alanyl-D-alanine carboxypeptidase [Brevundimonas sp.]|uniref:D-alanyl-D-alanine carboxypeptidase n=1 Tax=Brevundimonas sp. TaxID=1871086 RepID=UPI0025C34021|nr:D-alanyl-D-alanine carboxypeptidase [Brevundimonas sp.]
MTGYIRRIGAALLAISLAVALGVPFLSPVVAQSSDNARYAAIVVDATTGEVLFARRADDPRYPASVTKMMTLYLVFEAIEAGKVSVDDIVTVSPLAASQPPSKLGLAAGQTIRLDDAMRATTVRSANDMAMVLAEHVGGSQARFAAMATLKAQALGMTQTRYVNPNGLPDSRQITSARDLAILSRALMRDYPQYYSYFGLHDWNYQGREYRNTNGLLLGGNGYDGIKTGFTNASGYNLAASAVRDGRRIITIVLGGRSSVSRNAHVAELMNTGFEVESRRARGENIQVAQTFFEQRGFGIGSPDSTPGGGPVAYAAMEGERGPSYPPTSPYSGAAPFAAQPYRQQAQVQSPIHVAGSPPASTLAGARSYASVVATPPPTPAPTAPARTDSRPPANLTASLNGATTAVTRSAPPPAPRPAPAPANRWAVQVGAFREERVARDWLTEVNRRFRTQFLTAERSVQSAAGWYRSRFTNLTEQGAQNACEALAARRVTCVVVRPGA